MDDATVSRLVETHQVMVWRYLRLLGAEAALAEDLAQESFVKVLRSDAPFVERTLEETCAYLRRVARSVWLDHCRKHGRGLQQSEAEFEAVEELWHEHYADGGDERLDALELCLNGLVGEERGLLASFYSDQQPIKLIATRSGESESNVKTKLSRLRARLGECIRRRLQLDDEQRA